MADTQTVPVTPPSPPPAPSPDDCWWWPYPPQQVTQDHPAGYRSAWGANVKRDFDWFSPSGDATQTAMSEEAQKAWAYQRLVAELDAALGIQGGDHRTQGGDYRSQVNDNVYYQRQQYMDHRASYDEQRNDYRTAFAEQRGDIREGIVQRREDGQNFKAAMQFDYLSKTKDSHNAGLQMVYDNISDARVARSISYNVYAQKIAELETAKHAMDSATATLKEILGPPRGGATPVTSTPLTPSPSTAAFQPNPSQYPYVPSAPYPPTSGA